MEEMAPYIKNKTEVSEMFSEANLFQSYLDVEAALAKAQASQEIIPATAAEIISEKAKLELLDLQNVYDGLDKTGHPLVPLIWSWIEFAEKRRADIYTGVRPRKILPKQENFY